MNKKEAIQLILDIQYGSGVPERNAFPEEITGKLANRHWQNGIFSLGQEYGFIWALIKAFNITVKDLKN